MSLRLSMLMLAGLATMAQSPPAGGGPDFLSREKEALVAASIAAEVRKYSAVIDSPAARNYVRQLGQNLAAQLPEGEFSYTFEVLADSGSPMHEPAAAPGGHIFVPAHLLLAAESESEFAAVLAHSMAHAAERHSVRLGQRSQSTKLSNIPMMVIIHGRDMIVPPRYLNSLREFELEADRMAVQTMALAGHEPLALFRYLDRMHGGNTQSANSALLPREMRLANLRQALAALPASQYSSNTGDFERVRQEVRVLLDRIPRRPSLR